jgi:hypothetical protein
MVLAASLVGATMGPLLMPRQVTPRTGDSTGAERSHAAFGVLAGERIAAAATGASGTVPGRVVVRFDVKTPGAALAVKSDEEYRAVPASAAIALERDRTWTLEATELGFETLLVPLILSDAPEERVTVELRPLALSAVTASPPPAVPRPAWAERTVAPVAAREVARPAPASGGGHPCRLKLNSFPGASVAIDGRSLGDTPRVDVVVPPGNHRAVFTAGAFQKSVTFRCGEDEEKTLAVRL